MFFVSFPSPCYFVPLLFILFPIPLSLPLFSVFRLCFSAPFPFMNVCVCCLCVLKGKEGKKSFTPKNDPFPCIFVPCIFCVCFPFLFSSQIFPHSVFSIFSIFCSFPVFCSPPPSEKLKTTPFHGFPKPKNLFSTKSLDFPPFRSSTLETSYPLKNSTPFFFPHLSLNPYLLSSFPFLFFSIKSRRKPPHLLLSWSNSLFPSWDLEDPLVL